MIRLKYLFNKIDPALILVLTLLCILTISFWGSSRYPQLNAKAIMSSSLGLADLLGFDSIVSLTDINLIGSQVIQVFINWLYTNWKGMSFGYAAAVLLGIALIRIQSKSSIKFGDSTLLGILVGAPLGLCVNCASPVAITIYEQTNKLKNALATMLSSPSLNVLVIGIMFTLFPWYMAIIKIIGSFILVLVISPTIARLANSTNQTPQISETPINLTQHYTNVAAKQIETRNLLPWLSNALIKIGWPLAKKIIPLMLIAGLIGSALIVILPWDIILEHIPQLGVATKLHILLAMIALALFAVILPVPMSFDIFITSALFAIGLPAHYAMVLLFALGSYSIYPALLLHKVGQTRIGVLLLFAVAGLAVILGVVTHTVDKHFVEPRNLALFQLLKDLSPTKPLLEHQAVTKQHIPKPISYSKWNDRILSAPFLKPDNSSLSIEQKNSLFTATNPLSIGLQGQKKSLIQAVDINSVMSYIGGIASGDINNDGWQDLALSTVNGPRIFINIGGEFSALDLDVTHETSGIVVFADIDNDGWQDLLYSRYKNGGAWLKNNNGVFSAPKDLPVKNSHLTLSAALADLDNNGELDIVWGNHSNPSGLRFEPAAEESRNQVLYRKNNKFEPRHLNGQPGETLSILISDLDQDNWQDVWVGNDFEEPDVFYRGTVNGLIEDPTVKSRTKYTMSIDSSDINNDGQMAIYHAQISFQENKPDEFKIQALSDKIKEACQQKTPKCEYWQALQATTSTEPASCLKLAQRYQADCLAYALTSYLELPRKHSNTQLNSLCDLFREHYPSYYETCKQTILNRSLVHDYNSMIQITSPVTGNLMNSLHIFAAQNDELAQSRGVDNAGWSWNSRFSDLDADGFQDLYVVNGFMFRTSEPQNLWYKNIDGKKFDERALSVGLGSFDRTLSYTYIDYDNDGDLDIIQTTVAGDLKVFNNQTSNNSLQIELRDFKGNHFGIGSTITIYNNGKQQSRELKLSGGYMSFDAPIAHFGLANKTQVESIKIRWSTGEIENIPGPFLADHRYQITRNNNNSSTH